MTDTVSPELRAVIMGRVRSKNTRPEWAVRRLVHGMGYRYRLHRRTLPGTPDLVFAGRHKVIFVHGCFWHGHGCPLGRTPKSRLEFWVPKLHGNRLRDARNQANLKQTGWSILTIWECQLKNVNRLRARIRRFLDA